MRKSEISNWELRQKGFQYIDLAYGGGEGL